MPTAVLWLLNRLHLTKTVVGLLIFTLIMGLLFGLLTLGIAVMSSNPDEQNRVDCSGVNWDEPYQLKGVDYGQRLGTFFKRMTDGQNDPEDALYVIQAVMDVLALWRNAFLSTAVGDVDAQKAVTGYRTKQRELREKALASCCKSNAPAPDPTPAPDPPAESTEPRWDPKQASLQNPTRSEFTDEQISIAQTADRIRVERGLPVRAEVVILATGFQESGVSNLDHGDRDSLGWLQQRAGWGSAAQRQDPAYAAGKFFDALVQVNGWEQMSITRAAQAVQRSAFPDAYAKWEDEAKSLAAAAGSAPDAPSAPADPKAPAPSNCSPVTGTITTWNARFDNPGGDAAVVAGMKDIGRSASTISVQEFGNENWQRKSLAALGSNWRLSHGETDTGIFYDTRTYSKVSESVAPMFGVVQVEDGASGTEVGPRSFNILTLERAGQRFTIINSHMMPDWQGKRQRTAIFGESIDKLVALQGQYRPLGPVILTGDWNANIGDKELQPLVAAGCVATGSTLGVEATVGRHGSYDQVYSCGAAEPSSQMVFANHGSDHKGYGAVFTAPQTDVPAAPGVSAGSAPAEWERMNPRTPAEAVARMTAVAGTGHGYPGEPVSGSCERYMNLSYGRGAGYPTARAHWQAAGPRHTDGSVPPKGALVYFDTSNPAGHVALSAGGGQVISTDYNSQTHRFQSGMVGVGPISDIAKWGRVLGWRAPNFQVGAAA